MKKILNKLKKWFTEKPKKDFWMHAFWTLLIFRWVTPFALLIMTPLQLGLMAPETDFSETINRLSTELVESFTEILQTMFELGRDIALDSPITAKIMFYTINYGIYIIWAGMLILILNLCRYGTYYIFKKIKDKKKKTRKSK